MVNIWLVVCLIYSPKASEHMLKSTILMGETYRNIWDKS